MQITFNPKLVLPAARKITSLVHNLLLPVFDFDIADGLAFSVCQGVIVATIAQLAMAEELVAYRPFMLYLLIGTLIWTVIAMIRMAHYKWRMRNWWKADPTPAFLFYGSGIIGIAMILSSIMMPTVAGWLTTDPVRMARINNEVSPMLFGWGMLIGLGCPIWVTLHYRFKEIRNRIPDPKPYTTEQL